MNHIKLFEEWSPKFNRTLQGASAIATSTNKGFGKAAKAVKDYAEKQISKEEFSLETENGDKLIITHDANFLLNPISEFTKVNPGKLINAIEGEKGTYFNIPVKVKTSFFRGNPLEIELPIILFRSPDSLNGGQGKKMGEGGVDNSPVVLGPEYQFPLLRDKGLATRFSDNSGLENFIAMAIQSILSSPEKGTPIDVRFGTKESLDITPSHLGMESFPDQMTKEKFFLISLFKNNILNKDMREFTM
jgi:hypothetical protein